MGEPDVSELLDVRSAIQIIDQTPLHPRTVRLPLEQAAGHHLAVDLAADRDYPPFDKSLMDGFAVRAADVASAAAELKVVGEIAAGQSPARGIGPGETMAVMTGAPLPAGADGVVPVEDTVRSAGADSVRVSSAAAPGRYVAARGSDCRSGSIVLKRGTLLGAAQVAVAASVGAAEVDVFAAPRVAVLGTGDELVPVSAEPSPAQIRNSNDLMLAALLRQMRCNVTLIGTARDEPAAVREALLAGMKYDVLFVTGGMSMGEYDYVPRVLLELGVDLRITKLRIKPGKPFVFGVGKGCFVFGLPGNPVSGFVCTVRLAARLLRRLAGGEAEGRMINGALQSPLGQNGPREFYQPAVLLGSGVRPLMWKGSADIYTLAQANALIVRPENDPPRAAGEMVVLMEI